MLPDHAHLALMQFKIQSLEQELALKGNDAVWAHEELRKTTDELAQARNQAHHDVSTLTSQLQQAKQALEASESKIISLQAAYDGAIVRLEEGTREKSELRQRLVEQEGAFASEMSTQQRLSDLMEQQKESAERRVAVVEEQWEAILDQYREKEDALRSEISEQRHAREAVESEKQEIQLALDQLAESVGIETNGNGHMSSQDVGDVTDNSLQSIAPNRSFFSLTSSLMSPTAALASKVQRSGKSFTQVYAELARSQEELRRERVESNRIGAVLEQVMADLQERGPALVAQREECEQMSRDLEEMSATLAKACEERDRSEREAKNNRLESESNLRENRILNQQVTDLGRQVRDLTREILLRDDPAAAERLGDDGSHLVGTAAVSDTQAVITSELVTFRSLTDLVTQNGRLLRVVRELGTKMEAEEQGYRARLEAGESEAVAEATELIARLQDEVRAERARLEGIRRERDMFRSMCASGAARGQALSLPASASDNNTANVALTNQYSQLQAQFEAFRSETAKDTERLKEEAYQARSEASRSALSAAKEKASREGLEERLTNAQETHQMAKRELADLQRRLSGLQENLTRQEIASHSLSQQLLTANSNEERLRNEVGNLAAEKRLHQQTTERLIEEKKSSSVEKSNLAELLRNVQSMQAELERSSGEARRQLESRSEHLEEQCKELRAIVSREEEGHRQTSMRREVETTDLKSRLDRSNEELSKAREELAVAKSGLQHLTAKSEELQKQVDSKEEKLAVYERRNLGTTQTGSSSQESVSSLDQQQQLQVEIADLKGELRGAQIDAEQARGHVEQFKAIAVANEEALSQLQAAYDEYKTTTDSSVAEKTNDVNSMRERLEAIANELTSAQKEASTMRSELDKQSSAWKMEKRTLEDAMTELGGIEDRARQAQQNIQDEVRKQVKLTQEAHAKYEVELVAHAEDVKTLTQVKQELQAARTEVVEAKKGMETAQGNLASSKDSWEAQKVIYEREHEEVQKVIVELRGQNDALHRHLEALQNQTKEIRQAAAAAQPDIGDSSFSQSGNEELHEVIKYLRSEKKIVDLQVEVREQECARLRQSVEHMQRSLDEVRLQLSKERTNNAGASASAKQHEELMEKINQLSILRESNTTLRDESERSLRKVQALESQVDALTTEVLPLREDLRVKKVELEASENQLRLSQEDNKRWQGRTQSILQQYNRIDPEDLKKLQEKKEEAEKEVEEQKRVLAEKEKEVQTAREEVQNKQGQFDRLRAQSIERIKGLNQRNTELTSECEQLRSSQSQWQEAQKSSTMDNESALDTLKKSHEAVQDEKRQLEARVAALELEKVELGRRVEELERQIQDKPDGSATPAGDTDDMRSKEEAAQGAVEEAKKAWAMEKQSMDEKRQAIERREQLHLQKAKEFNTLMKAAVQERDELKIQMAEGETRLREQWANEHASEIEAAVLARTGDATGEAVLDTLRQRVAQLEAELEQANTRIKELEAGASTPDTAELQQRHEAALKEQQSRLTAQFGERQKSAVEIAVSKAKAAATAEISEGSTAVEEQVQAKLKTFAEEKEQQVNAAIEGKEKELKAAYEDQLKARYEAGKEEANLRNKLMLKSKDNRIEKLTNELNTLKGTEGGSSAAAPTASGPSSGAAPSMGTQRPPTPRPTARPVPSPTAAAVPAGPARGGPGNRGAGPGRGNPRPTQQQGANVQKRKLETGQQQAGPSGGNAANGAVEGGGLPKRPRPAGGAISIRGGAGGNRGGRGGHAG